MSEMTLEQHRKQESALFNELNSNGWISRYMEISKFLLPRMGRYFESETNRYDNSKWTSIIDQTGCRAHRILSSGLMSSKSSKARPWFRLTIPDKQLMKFPIVKQWLFDMQNLFEDIFAESNTYRALQQSYDELTGFGTAPMLIDRDFDNIIHCSPLTAGQFAMAVDAKGNINTLYRRVQLKVGQIVGEFGYDNCSQTVKNAYDQGNYHQPIDIVHGICPRMERDTTSPDNKNMAFESVYYEKGQTDNTTVLRRSGFRRFPGMAPRWDVLGAETYGVSPSMYALGMIKSLQFEQMQKAKAIDWMTNPTLQFPSSLKGQNNRVIPGGIVYADSLGGNNKIQSLFDVRLDLSHLLNDINDVRNSVNQAFYVDLFLMASEIDSTGVTAREIAEKHEEKLLMLGPVDMRLDFELFDKLIDLAFDFVMDSRLSGGVPLMPPPPPELSGMELRVEYTSILSQAQKLVGLESIDRIIGVVGNIAKLKPDVLDKIDSDRIVDIYSDKLGVDPSIVLANKDVAIIRQSRAQQQKQQQQQAMMPQAMRDIGAGAKAFSDAAEGGGTLTNLIQRVPGMEQFQH